MAGGFLAEQNEVVIFDGNEKAGKKLFITGKGRCNITNNCSKEEFISNVVNGGKFMMSAINNFDCQQTMTFFEELGLNLKTERGNRVFPESDKSSDVIKTLLYHARNCQINLNEKVLVVSKEEQFFKVKTEKKSYLFDRVIIATGGKSYPATGSQGDGYKFAKMIGHEVVEPKGALVPIKIKDNFCAQLEGLSLKNVTLKANINKKKKELFGEMLFTFDAISGPIALSMSSYISGIEDISLSLDFKPALTIQMLENRILKDFEENLNKNISFIIKGLLPTRLVEIFLSKVGINKDRKVNSITISERKNIVNMLKNFKLDFAGLYDVKYGIITSGGVKLSEVNPKTMESKKTKGLYFIGEVLDVDCLTGGFNLQTAFSTAYACAKYMN